MLWVGIDTGGTFTDLVAYNSDTKIDFTEDAVDAG